MFDRKSVYSSRSADKFVLRLPEGMREQIAEVATANHRSMNSELVSRLKASLDEDDSSSVSTPVDSPEITAHERELLKHFRQLAKRQKNAVLELIVVNTGDPNEDASNT